MLGQKKSKTEKSPHQSNINHHNKIYLFNQSYHSTQLKNPYYVKNKQITTKSIGNGNGNLESYENSVMAKSMSVKSKNRDRERERERVREKEGLKTNRKLQKSLGNSFYQYKIVNTAKKTTKPDTIQLMPSGQSRQYKIQDLLGLSSKVSKKQSLTNSTHPQLLSSITSQQLTNSYQNSQMNPNSHSSVHAHPQMIKLRTQNEQLLRINEQLLYEKQYFRQKTILQEVQIRDLTRRVNEIELGTRSRARHGASGDNGKRYHYKNKSYAQESELSFKLRTEEQRSDFYLLKGKKLGNLQNLENFGTGTSKSSLLISQSDQERIPLQQKNNQDFQSPYQSCELKRAESQFAQLLQNVQNENNYSRKTTLRKMLAMKAMQLKKAKQKN